MSVLLSTGGHATKFEPEALIELILRDIGHTHESAHVEFVFRMMPSGMGIGERSVQVFDGVRVTFKKPPVSPREAQASVWNDRPGTPNESPFIAR
jgi:hypothetical protein